MWRLKAEQGIQEIDFYSHIPCGMWHCKEVKAYAKETISTHTSRVGCDSWKCIRKWIHDISTHTSRVGCDLFFEVSDFFYLKFYSHIPCGMWHHKLWQRWLYRSFLLTHPVWDVTWRRYCENSYCNRFLLTHPVWDVTDLRGFGCSSIKEFLLTHPVWDVTLSMQSSLLVHRISTHTSRVGCDAYWDNSL